MSTHDQTHESLDAYLAGGLTPAERTDIEAHIDICAECAQTVKDSRQLEQTMNEVFAKDRPDPALEERAIAKLRKSRIKRATAWRFVGAAAAVLLFGVLGAALQAVALSKTTKDVEARMERWTGQANSGQRASDVMVASNSVARSSTFGVVDVDPSQFETDQDVQFKRKGKEAANEAAMSSGRDHLASAYFHKEGRSELASNLDGKGAISGLNAAGTLTPDNKVGGTNALLAGDLAIAPEGDEQAKVGEVIILGNTVTNDRVIRRMVEDIQKGQGLNWEAPRISERFNNKADVANRTKKITESGYDQKKAEQEMFGNEINQKERHFRDVLKADPGGDYFKPADPGKTEPTKAPLLVSEAKSEPPKDGPPEKRPSGGEEDKKGEPADPGHEPADRKIIRTGEIEFEIDSFDNAAAAVNRLIGAVKGGFVSTTNSEKLPNGKMKGSIVVRMPPEHLDKFILDLRRELAKVGDLRSQRIGSQDVTKQYTDTESELKAARVVEGRLIEIIKNGKGDVKDLVAAEHELGGWRTKIEKMEGEIRYYKNLIALSTLTISLYEKEIQAPSALVITDHVKMRIEVEHVTEAHKAALKAVADVKGRVTKSELKQHKAGQLEAILHAEIPPAQKDTFRDQLKKLGIVSEHEETQRQQAEGGTGKAPGIKPQVSDVQFEVALNNIVNIQPRHSVSLVVATLDVPGQFAKLKEAISKTANGQIRDAQISQKNRENVSAVIDFNVPIDQKAALDKLIGEAGPILARTASQVAVTEVATERKYGYKLFLESAGNVAPREKIALKIEVEDVEGKMAEMKGKINAAKGRVLDEKSGLQPDGQAGAKLVFEVPLAAEDALVAQIKASGKRVSYDTQRNAQVPDNDLATAQITVVLVGVRPIVSEDDAFLRVGLARSYRVFAWCVVAIITGLGAVLPVGVVLFVMYWLIRKMWPTSAVKPTPANNP